MNLTFAFFLALAAVETPQCIHSGDYCYCIGDAGAALGRYQIHSIYVRDVNRIAGTTYTHKDAYHTPTAEIMVRIYLRYYGDRLGMYASTETMARMHNGGPTGWEKESTFDYWRKFWQALERIEDE